MDSITAFEGRVRQMESDLSEMRQRYMEAAQRQFTDILMFIFEEFPQVEKLRWQHGIPGYCDGGPCDFRLRGIDVFFTKDTLTEYRNENGDLSWVYGTDPYISTQEGLQVGVDRGETFESYRYEYERDGRSVRVPYVEKAYSYEYVEPWLQPLEEALNRLINEDRQDLLISVFGDGAEVSINRNGTTEVSEYYMEG